MSSRSDVAVVGLGYVGLTLAVTLAQVGLRVWGFERESQVVEQLKSGRCHIFEPGLEDALQEEIQHNLTIESHPPEDCPEVAIICVSTPLGPGNVPDLHNLKSAAESVAENMDAETLVVVRSTVPVGTSRHVVLPTLLSMHPEARLAFCPERTIQGRALKELRRLPQIVGALDEASQQVAVRLWHQVTEHVVPVSSLEAAEMIKLINNSHTDLVYAFGNEVAMMASQLRLDPLELIRAANVNYPRPDLAKPGFVGGSCLTKDPYLLLSSFGESGYEPRLVSTARHINESLPKTIAKHFLESVPRVGSGLNGAKVLVCGFAYKGWPATDDVRGSSTAGVMEELGKLRLRIYGHDYLVSGDTISAMGAIPVEDLDKGFDDATAVIFLNEHPDYRQLDTFKFAQRMKRPAVIYDCWRMFDADDVDSIPGMKYAGIGFG